MTRTITYWDLFGTDDILDSEYLREKMIAENLRKISLTHLFKRSFDQEDIVTVAKQALSAQAPQITPVTTLNTGTTTADTLNAGTTTANAKDSLEDILNEC